jgi:hypothetical protein
MLIDAVMLSVRMAVEFCSAGSLVQAALRFARLLLLTSQLKRAEAGESTFIYRRVSAVRLSRPIGRVRSWIALPLRYGSKWGFPRCFGAQFPLQDAVTGKNAKRLFGAVPFAL